MIFCKISHSPSIWKMRRSAHAPLDGKFQLQSGMLIWWLDKNTHSHTLTRAFFRRKQYRINFNLCTPDAPESYDLVCSTEDSGKQIHATHTRDFNTLFQDSRRKHKWKTMFFFLLCHARPLQPNNFSADRVLLYTDDAEKRGVWRVCVSVCLRYSKHICVHINESIRRNNVYASANKPEKHSQQVLGRSDVISLCFFILLERHKRTTCAHESSSLLLLLARWCRATAMLIVRWGIEKTKNEKIPSFDALDIEFIYVG